MTPDPGPWHVPIEWLDSTGHAVRGADTPALAFVKVTVCPDAAAPGRPILALVDTGSDRTTISAPVLKLIGAKPAGAAMTAGAAAFSDAAEFVVVLRVPGTPIVIRTTAHSVAHPFSRMSRASGRLGMDVLRHGRLQLVHPPASWTRSGLWLEPGS